MVGSKKPAAVTRYFQPKLAVIEVQEGETQEEAWRRHLITHPGHRYARIKIFHFPPEDPLGRTEAT